MPFTDAPTSVCTVKVQGSPLAPDKAALMSEAVIHSTLAGPDSASLTFADHRHVIADDSALRIGAALELAIVRDGRPTTLFSGEIMALESVYDEHGNTVVIRAMDKTHRLMAGRKVEAYTKVSATDVVRRLAQEAGLTVRAETSPVVHEHVTRMNETPWELVTRLAREIGWVAGSSKGSLYFTAQPPASAGPEPGSTEEVRTHQLVAGENLLHARVEVTGAGQVPSVIARGWDPKTKQGLEGRSTATTAAATSAMGDPKSVATRLARSPDLVTGTPYATQAEVDAAAAGRAERLASGYTTLVGLAVGDPALAAGVAVSVAGLGARFAGRYVLGDVRHVLSVDGYTTEVTAAGARDVSLLGLASGGGRTDDHRPRIDGVVPAIVTNVNDPDDGARVKLKFPWLDESFESDWARLSQMASGNGYGVLFLPEVNDEVLVAFDRGDVAHPYVVGRLYNGKDRPDKTSADLVKGGKVATRRITSRSGQGLVFFDSDGSTGVRLRSGDEKLWIDVNQGKTTIAVTSEGTVTITGKQGVTIESDAGIDLKAKQKVTIAGEQGVSIQGATVEVKGKTGATVDAGGGPLTLKGTGGEVSSTAVFAVKAAAVLTIQGALVKIN